MLALGLTFSIIIGMAGCGKEEQMKVSEVQFPLKEKAELSFITSAPATSTQNPNERIIFKRLEKETNVHIDWTCFVADQFSDKKNLALAQFGNLPDGLFNAGMSDYDLLRYAKQGIIIPLENLIDKYMPNLERKQFRRLEIFHISIRNGLIIWDWKYQLQQMNWNRY